MTADFQGVTPRGFGYSEFTGYSGPALSVQDSSLATTRCLWIGPEGRERSHLTEDRVREVRDLLTSWLGDGAVEQDVESDERECSRCGDGVQILNSQDECSACEAERAQQAADEAAARATIRKGTALAAALAELDADGYVHTTAGGNYRPRGTKPGKRLYSLATIDALKKIVPLDYTGYCTYGKVTS